jgi:hypothetical protein
MVPAKSARAHGSESESCPVADGDVRFAHPGTPRSRCSTRSRLLSAIARQRRLPPSPVKQRRPLGDPTQSHQNAAVSLPGNRQQFSRVMPSQKAQRAARAPIRRSQKLVVSLRPRFLALGISSVQVGGNSEVLQVGQLERPLCLCGRQLGVASPPRLPLEASRPRSSRPQPWAHPYQRLSRGYPHRRPPGVPRPYNAHWPCRSSARRSGSILSCRGRLG